jgi:cytochrome c5
LNGYTAPPVGAGTPDKIVSKQDTHFFNVFSMVIGLLAAFAVCIFALSRYVAARTQDLQVMSEVDYARDVAARLAQPSREAVSGQDNTALAIKAQGPSAAGSATIVALPKDGKALFEQTCSVCHGQGIAGAPKAGDKSAWGPRIAKGKSVLYQHALNGFQGTSGVMPPKGGRTDVPDDLVKQAVDYMVQMAQ